MKERLRDFVLGILIFCFIFGISTLAATTQKEIDVTYRDIKLQIDGEEVTPRDSSGNIVEPFIYNGTTYLPVRAVAEALERDVSWDNETSTVHINEKEAKKAYLYDLEPTRATEKADYYKLETDSGKYVGFKPGKALEQQIISKGGPYGILYYYTYENSITFAVPENATYFSGCVTSLDEETETVSDILEMDIYSDDDMLLIDSADGEFQINVSGLKTITFKCEGQCGNDETVFPYVIKDAVFYLK